MKRTLAVYVATTLLLIQIASVSWTAVHIKHDPRYMLSPWLIVVIAIGLTAFFYWKPKIGRWYVIPYFAVLSLSVFPKLARLPDPRAIAGITVGVLMGISDLLLICLPLLPERDAKAG